MKSPIRLSQKDQLTFVWSSYDARGSLRDVTAQFYTYKRDPININGADTSNCSYWMDTAMHMVLSGWISLGNALEIFFGAAIR